MTDEGREAISGMDEVTVGANPLSMCKLLFTQPTPAKGLLGPIIGSPKWQLRGTRLGLQVGPHIIERDIFTLSEKSRFGPTHRFIVVWLHVPRRQVSELPDALSC